MPTKSPTRMMRKTTHPLQAISVVIAASATADPVKDLKQIALPCEPAGRRAGSRPVRAHRGWPVRPAPAFDTESEGCMESAKRELRYAADGKKATISAGS